MTIINTNNTLTPLSVYTGSLYSNTRYYTGREYDLQRNVYSLYYHRARYYNPNTGRFLSRDPIGQNDQVNLYTYVRNSPLMYTDRDGKAAKRAIAWLGDVASRIFSPEQTYGDLNPSPIVEKDIGLVGETVVMGGGLLLPGGKKKAAEKASEAFFEGAKYTEKVIGQMTKDIRHGFPIQIDELVKRYGTVTNFLNGDLTKVSKLSIPGEIVSESKVIKSGVFEYIKDSAGNINHRFFNVNR